MGNPEYKGPWSPKMIDNPAYKGEWEHPLIDNPDYKEDKDLYLRCKECTHVGFELWQVKSGTIFDDIIVTDSFKEAKEYAEKTFTKKKGPEKEMYDAKEAEKKAEADRVAAENAAAADEEDEDDEDDDHDVRRFCFLLKFRMLCHDFGNYQPFRLCHICLWRWLCSDLHTRRVYQEFDILDVQGQLQGCHS